MDELTLGDYRVERSFNPSKNEAVDAIKAKAAELIDLIEELKPEFFGVDELNSLGLETLRLCTIAQDQIESAAMFAVKAATK